MRIVLSCLLALVLSFPAFAGQEELSSARQAYRAAMDVGDVHGAFPFAQAAYEESLALNGPDNRTTGIVALFYGRALSAVERHAEADVVLTASLAAFRSDEAAGPGEEFAAIYDLGRAQRHIPRRTGDQEDYGDETLLEARDLATELYGPASPEVGLVSFELARPSLYYVSEEAGNIDGVQINPGYEAQDVRLEALAQATEIFAANPGFEFEALQLQVFEGLRLLGDGERRASDAKFEPAFATLAANQFADDLLVAVYLAWVNSQNLSNRELGAQYGAVAQFARFRLDGEIHELARAAPEYPRSLERRNVQGWVKLGFDLSPQGRPQNVTVVESHPGDAFADVSLASMSESWYLPRMVNGEPVATEDVTYTYEFVMEARSTNMAR